jgi:hypothetical protein
VACEYFDSLNPGSMFYLNCLHFAVTFYTRNYELTEAVAFLYWWVSSNKNCVCSVWFTTGCSVDFLSLLIV